MPFFKRHACDLCLLNPIWLITFFYFINSFQNLYGLVLSLLNFSFLSLQTKRPYNWLKQMARQLRCSFAPFIVENIVSCLIISFIICQPSIFCSRKLISNISRWYVLHDHIIWLIAFWAAYFENDTSTWHTLLIFSQKIVYMKNARTHFLTHFIDTSCKKLQNQKRIIINSEVNLTFF